VASNSSRVTDVVPVVANFAVLIGVVCVEFGKTICYTTTLVTGLSSYTW